MIHTIIDSPIDELTLVADDTGALTAIYMVGHRHQPGIDTFGERVTPAAGPGDVFAPVIEQLGEYFAGQRREFALRTAATGTPFQAQVWEALTRIPFGETRSYGELAADIGNPKAVRAVGLANGRNPLSIVVPCHRVIGASGAITGYGGGVERKVFLLGLEGVGQAPGLLF